MVAIQVMSDLYIDRDPSWESFRIQPTALYLALLGNIGLLDDALFTFLEMQLCHFRIVFYVLGPHELRQSS